MAQYNSEFANQVNQTPSLTGEETIRVDQIDFDTTCPCQITACDGGTIKVCAKMEIEDLVIDSLCIDGELGCDSLVVETGTTNGIKFSDDPCATPATTRRRVLYEEATATKLVSLAGRTLDLATEADDITVRPGRDLSVTSVRDILLTCGTGGPGSFVGTASKYFNTVFSTNVMGSYLGTVVSPFSEVFTELIGNTGANSETKNIFSRRINLMSTIGGLKKFPSPDGPELILPRTTITYPYTFPGDAEGDMLVGYRSQFSSGGLTLYMVVDARINPASPLELRWYRLQTLNPSFGIDIAFQPY